MKQPNIYIYSYTGATGGLELLQQLCYHLNKMGCKATMFFDPQKTNPIHKEYEHYGNPFTFHVPDSVENLVIFPEVALTKIMSFKKCRRIVWWLSVDNYFKSYNYYKSIPFTAVNFLRSLKATHFGTKPVFDVRKHHKQIEMHLVQSSYAEDYLNSQGIPSKKIAFLTDYLNRNFLINAQQMTERLDQVAYNPKKGLDFTQKIIEQSAGKIKFVPIENMSSSQVADLLKQSKVYIDFGNHPGKDRIPREAAISGCCVITGKKGSAAFAKDVPILQDYKFDEIADSIPNILTIISDCINNYSQRIGDFESWRKEITNQEEKFGIEVQQFYTLLQVAEQ